MNNISLQLCYYMLAAASAHTYASVRQRSRKCKPIQPQVFYSEFISYFKLQIRKPFTFIP